MIHHSEHDTTLGVERAVSCPRAAAPQQGRVRPPHSAARCRGFRPGPQCLSANAWCVWVCACICVALRSQRVTLDGAAGDDAEKFMRTFLQLCSLGDFKSDDEKKDTIQKCLARITGGKESAITKDLVRVEDEKEKETPLHKLARVKVSPGGPSPRAHGTCPPAAHAYTRRTPGRIGRRCGLGGWPATVVSIAKELCRGERPPLLRVAVRVRLRPQPSTDAGAETFKKYFGEITKLMKDAGDKLHSDVNHQNKDGKTPLYLAIEFKNKPMIDALFELGTDGPDSLLVNTNGWTIMHAAVNANDLQVLKHICEKKLTPSRVKALLAKQDKTGREPLHIAAYKCDEEIVSYLIKMGAQNKKADKAGNDASELAKKAGRRRSREILSGKEEEKKAPPSAAPSAAAPA